LRRIVVEEDLFAGESDEIEPTKDKAKVKIGGGTGKHLHYLPNFFR